MLEAIAAWFLFLAALFYAGWRFYRILRAEGKGAGCCGGTCSCLSESETGRRAAPGPDCSGDGQGTQENAAGSKVRERRCRPKV